MSQIERQTVQSNPMREEAQRLVATYHASRERLPDSGWFRSKVRLRDEESLPTILKTNLWRTWQPWHILQTSAGVRIDDTFHDRSRFSLYRAMPRSQANLNGDNSPQKLAYGHFKSFGFEPFPGYGGEKSVIYRSADGTRVAGVARESGTCSLTFDFDEFMYTVKGWVDVNVHGGDKFRLTEGDVIYFTKGTTADFVFSDDFWNIATFASDSKVTEF